MNLTVYGGVSIFKVTHRYTVKFSTAGCVFSQQERGREREGIIRKARLAFIMIIPTNGRIIALVGTFGQ